MRFQFSIFQKCNEKSDFSKKKLQLVTSQIFSKKNFKVTGKTNFYCLIDLISLIQILDNNASTFKLIISMSIFNCKI
jgi:hypothetical protein